MLNERYEGDSEVVSEHVLQARLQEHRVEAARLAVRSGRSDHWLKVKNPAVRREAEEDCR